MLEPTNCLQHHKNTLSASKLWAARAASRRGLYTTRQRHDKFAKNKIKSCPAGPAGRPLHADTRALAYTHHTPHTCVANHRHVRIVTHAVELASPDKLRPLTSCGVGGHRRCCQGKQCKDVSASRVSRACISRCCHCCCQSPAKRGGGRKKSARMLHDNITSGSHSWPTRWRVRRRAHCAA